MRPAISLTLCFLLSLSALSDADRLRTVTPEDAKKWELAGPAELSSDGKWAAMSIRLVEGDSKIVVREVDGEKAWTFDRAIDPAFSPDCNWIAYRMPPTRTKVEEIRQSGKRVPTDLSLRSLAEDESELIEDVKSYRFLHGGKALVALTEDGTLHLLDLEADDKDTLKDVEAFAVNSEGTKIALCSKDDGESEVSIIDVGTGDHKPLTEGPFTVSGLTWAKKADKLAFLVGTPISGMEGAYNRLVVASNLSAEAPALRVLDPVKTDGFPKDHRIVENALPEISDDGWVVSFGIRPWTKTLSPNSASTVEVWNAKDTITYPERKANKDSYAKRSLLYAWRLKDDELVKISESLSQEPMMMPGFRHAVIMDSRPYQGSSNRNFIYWDIEIVSINDGKRRPAFTKADNPHIPSRTGRYFAVYDDAHWWLYDVETGKKSNVTESAGVSFANQYRDFGTNSEAPMEPAYWTANDAGVLFYDKYDAWLYRPATGEIKRITEGRKDKSLFRLEPLPVDERSGADCSKPMLFRSFDEIGKQTAFWTVDATGKTNCLLKQPAAFRFVRKAAGADRLLYSQASFEKPTTYYVCDSSFQNPRPLLATNPQQDQFAWGKAELIEYKSKAGTPLRGVLIYPAGYDPSKTYPMVTSVYERQSDMIHQYIAPVQTSPYNVQVFSQNGYFVLLPDIVYENKRMPGPSAVECVEAALDAVQAKKVGVDPKRIGIMGHSWGGYEAAYISTVSKRFAAGVCGSGLTDFASISGGHYYKTGLPMSVVVEVGQARMDVPFWEDQKAYIENSAVWQSAKRTAPLLIQVGENDDIVDWNQGLFLYNTLRRQGKDAVLLVYRNEGHSLSKKANQEDYAQRLRHFFDVHLKNAQAEPWLSQPYRE